MGEFRARPPAAPLFPLSPRGTPKACPVTGHPPGKQAGGALQAGCCPQTFPRRSAEPRPGARPGPVRLPRLRSALRTTPHPRRARSKSEFLKWLLEAKAENRTGQDARLPEKEDSPLPIHPKKEELGARSRTHQQQPHRPASHRGTQALPPCSPGAGGGATAPFIRPGASRPRSAPLPATLFLCRSADLQRQEGSQVVPEGSGPTASKVRKRG